MKKLNDNTYMKELRNQMILFDKCMKSLTKEDIQYGIGLFYGMNIQLSEEILRNALAEYVVSGNKELLSIVSYDNFSIWYIVTFKHFIELYPNITVSDITWLQMLFKENKLEMTRDSIYVVIEEYYNRIGNTLSLNKTTGKKIYEQYIKDNTKN